MYRQKFRRYRIRTGRITAASLLAAFVLILFPCGMESVKAEKADVQESTETLPETVTVDSGADSGAEKIKKQLPDRIMDGPGNGGEDTDIPEDDLDTPEDDPDIPGDGQPAEIIASVIPVSQGELFEQLSSFLTLSSEQFQIYMVTGFADGSTGQPVQPEEGVGVSLTVPADYDFSRLVISEISMEGTVPQRTELPYWTETDSSGSMTAVFFTDHIGIFALMEMKTKPELPEALDPTEKVEKLELEKLNSPLAVQTGTGTSFLSPKTGDDSPIGLWAGITAAAAAMILIVVVLIIIFGRRKK